VIFLRTDTSDVNQLDDSFALPNTSFDCGDLDELMKGIEARNAKGDWERKYEEISRDIKKVQAENEQLRREKTEMELANNSLKECYEKCKLHCESLQRNETTLRKEKETLEVGILQMKKNYQKEKESIEVAYAQLKNSAQDKLRRLNDEVKRLSEELERSTKQQSARDLLQNSKISRLEILNRSLTSQLASKERENIALENMAKKIPEHVMFIAPT